MGHKISVVDKKISALGEKISAYFLNLRIVDGKISALGEKKSAYFLNLRIVDEKISAFDGKIGAYFLKNSALIRRYSSPIVAKSSLKIGKNVTILSSLKILLNFFNYLILLIT